jgi:hypothetical protein
MRYKIHQSTGNGQTDHGRQKGDVHESYSQLHHSGNLPYFPIMIDVHETPLHPAKMLIRKQLSGYLSHRIYDIQFKPKCLKSLTDID